MNEQTVAHSKTWVTRSIAAAAATTAALVFGGVAAADTHHYPTAPDSFLMYQVDSTSELVAALKADPALRQRYARHFGIPQDHIVDFVNNALVPYKLPEARTVSVYGVTKSGRIYPVRTRLAKGTKVWATRSGVPILKWLCANPLVKTLPGTKLAKARTSKSAPRTKVADAGVREVPAGDMGIPIDTEPLLSLPPTAVTALSTPSLPVVPTASGIFPVPGPVTAKANYGLLFPIGLILLSTLGNGSGGTGGAVSPVLPPIPVETAEAPEPGSVALIVAAGIPLLGALYRRRPK
jgi:hypothetical protein